MSPTARSNGRSVYPRIRQSGVASGAVGKHRGCRAAGMPAINEHGRAFKASRGFAGRQAGGADGRVMMHARALASAAAAGGWAARELPLVAAQCVPPRALLLLSWLSHLGEGR